MHRPLVLIAACLGATIAAADTEAEAWLDKMNQAVETLNYQGTFIYRHGEHVESMQIVHGFDEGGERERLVSLTGEAREIIRDRDVLTCIWPGSRSVVIESGVKHGGLPAVLPGAGDQATRSYDYSVGRTQRVAGLLCREVGVTPRDRLRFGYRVCVAEESGLPLRSEIVDADGHIVEQVMFTSIEVMDRIPEEGLKPQITPTPEYTTRGVDVDEDAVSQEADPRWVIDNLPPGFSVTANFRRRMAEDRGPVQHILLSDGLASVSVFIARPEAPDQLYHGVSGSGALHAFTTVVGEHQVTVIGEVPEATVAQIGQSLRYAEASP